MKKIIIAGLLLLIVFAVVFHQRIFIRDPLGKVDRDGSPQEDARLYINYSNDVLVENAGHKFFLVQSPVAVPGVPQHLFCFTGLLCWTDADQATAFPVDGIGGKTAVMSAREVTFVDGTGVKVIVRLR